MSVWKKPLCGAFPDESLQVLHRGTQSINFPFSFQMGHLLLQLQRQTSYLAQADNVSNKCDTAKTSSPKSFMVNVLWGLRQLFIHDLLIFLLMQDSSKVYTTQISYLEIYNECGYDLLDPRHEAARLEDLPWVNIFLTSANLLFPPLKKQNKSHMDSLTCNRWPIIFTYVLCHWI